MIVYGDLLFLINFSMDFLCFYFTCLLTHRKLPTLRACTASVLGGIYSVAALFLTAPKAWATFVDVIMLILMCLLVFAERKMRISSLLASCLLYFFNSALLGGIMTALFSLFNKLEIDGGELGDGEGIDVWIFAALAVLATVITVLGGRAFRSASHIKKARLEIHTEHGSVTLDALVDSGNLACEPISGKSVIFVNLSACANILSPDLREALEQGADVENIPISSGVRFVASGGIGGRTLTPAVHPREMWAITGGRRKRIDAYVAIVGDGTIESCDAIISDSVLV